MHVLVLITILLLIVGRLIHNLLIIKLLLHYFYRRWDILLRCLRSNTVYILSGVCYLWIVTSNRGRIVRELSRSILTLHHVKSVDARVRYIRQG